MMSGGWILNGCRIRYFLRELSFFRSWDLHKLTRTEPTRPRLVSTWDAANAIRMNARTPEYLGHRVIEKLYRAVTHCVGLPSLSPRDLEEEMLSKVLHAVEVGELVAVEVERSAPPRVPEVEQEAPPPPAKDEPTWFEVRLVWDDTGEPVSGVTLFVDPGRGSASMLQTDGDGRIRVDPVPGACSVRSKADGLKHKECATYVGDGDRPPPPNPPQERRESPSAVAVVKRHRVRAGETLESVAAAAGLTWQKLAKFNFGTEDRKEVNAHLAADVGCSERAANETDYVFTDEDEPGVLLVPKPLALNLMAAGVHHVLRVMPANLPKPLFWFSA